MKRLTYLLLCLLMPAMAAAENAPVKYTDAASLTIVNKAQPGGPAFQRIDVARYPELTPTVTRYYRYSTGLAVVFRTDSRNIRARWTSVNQLPGANSTLIAQRGLDLYIRRDGKWVFAGVGVPSKSGTQHEAPVVEHMDTTMKECLLYLPLHDEIAALEIGTDEGALLEAAPDPFRHRIVVIGSSITHGTSASRPGMAYAARLRRTPGPHPGIRVHQPRGQRAMQARYILRAHRRGDPGRRLSVRHLFEPVGPTDRRAAGRVRPAHPRKPSHDAVDLPPDGGARKRKLRPEKTGFRRR